MVPYDRLRRVKSRQETHCQLGVHINKGTESISFCSAVTRPGFTWSSINILTILLRPGSLTWIQRVTGPVTFGTFGCEAFRLDNSTVIASKDLIDRKRAIASTHTSCFWIRMRGQSPGSRIGIFWPPAGTIPPAA